MCLFRPPGSTSTLLDALSSSASRVGERCKIYLSVAFVTCALCSGIVHDNSFDMACRACKIYVFNGIDRNPLLPTKKSSSTLRAIGLWNAVLLISCRSGNALLLRCLATILAQGAAVLRVPSTDPVSSELAMSLLIWLVNISWLGNPCQLQATAHSGVPIRVPGVWDSQSSMACLSLVTCFFSI